MSGSTTPRITAGIPDLTSGDKKQGDKEASERLKAELIQAFSAPEPSYRPLTAIEVIARNR